MSARSLPLLVRWLLALAGILALAAPARAECGDHVTIDTHADRKAPAPVEAPLPLGHCPLCSQHTPTAPLAPVPVPPSVSLDCLWLLGVLSAAPLSGACRTDPYHGRPLHQTEPLLRPPRA